MSFTEINKITETILKCAFKVHTQLGAGLLESAYEECLFYELTKNWTECGKTKTNASYLL